MTLSVVRRLMLMAVLIAAPVMAFAQEAVLTGTVTDSRALSFPVSCVVAVHEATGNRFETVTDGQGAFRVPARVGTYRLTASLQGFASVTRTGLQAPRRSERGGEPADGAVNGPGNRGRHAEAPLLNVATSSLGGNINPQQVQELPVQGRNWMSLAMLAPGSRMTNPDDNTPIANRGADGDIRQYTVQPQQDSRSPRKWGLAGSRVTARIRSANSSTSPTASTRRWGGRLACRWSR